MLENKDQEIKVFGWMIKLGSKSEEETMIGSEIEVSASECTSFDENLLCSKQSKNRGNEACSTLKRMNTNSDNESSISSSLEDSNNQGSSTQDLIRSEDHKDELSTTTQRDPKQKPEEILPCPRCNSMNTKFCYFNNYNVNQPRYYCKNCQRYWTAGGCMRSMAVGSGRRKSKISDSATGPNSGDRTSPNGLIRPKMGDPMENWPTYGWVCHFVPNPNSHHFLGKHSRDGTLLEPMKENISKNSRPLTFRIDDDPTEVARSSVWGSLEVEKDKERSLNMEGRFFVGFEQNRYKGEGSYLANQANPAAFCRSLSFHEVVEQG